MEPGFWCEDPPVTSPPITCSGATALNAARHSAWSWGYEADTHGPEPCPGMEPEAEDKTHHPGPTAAPTDRQQLVLPVVITPAEPAPLATANNGRQAPGRQQANRRALPLRSWWQIGHPAAVRDGATVASAYRALYGIAAPKKQGSNVYMAPELDAVEDYLTSEKWTEQTH